MKNTGVYILAVFLLVVVSALGIAAAGAVSGLPAPSLGPVKYIWAGGIVVLAALVAFFIWLIRKGK
jgi:hypothetical protein